MLRYVAIKQDFRCFKTGDQIDIGFNRPVVLLVGDVGSGKSSLIELVRCVTSSPEQHTRQWVPSGFEPVCPAFAVNLSGSDRMSGYSRTV